MLLRMNFIPRFHSCVSTYQDMVTTRFVYLKLLGSLLSPWFDCHSWPVDIRNYVKIRFDDHSFWFDFLTYPMPLQQRRKCKKDKAKVQLKQHSLTKHRFNLFEIFKKTCINLKITKNVIHSSWHW